MVKIKKLLIANRGEIACRIINTAQAMGIATVAVYSSPDHHARHVRMTDEAMLIGPAATQLSYLNIPAIIKAALATHCDAIHPGYGFLSENPDFAQACHAANIIFIGPPIEALRLMADKNAAKEVMQAAGVPTTPGFYQENASVEKYQAEAKKMGYPILIKALAGGGGKGMRKVVADADFIDAYHAAEREAKNYFGDSRLLLEKYLEKPRHVEMQIFCDHQGNAVHLFERDCSVQRRQQKLIEEAPAPNLSARLRQQLGAAAVQAGKAIHYLGAGTIEFLVDHHENFYFMEMNTRLQVEHGVTEKITGLDLVEWQIRVAQGEPLPITDQNAIKQHGHAIEVRLYAENPYQNFMPSAGRLRYFHLQVGSQLRNDTGYETNDDVSLFYDALLAKIIAFAPTREAARQVLAEALLNAQIVGVTTNRLLQHHLLLQPDFQNGQHHTQWLEDHPDLLQINPQKPDDKALQLLAVAMLQTQDQQAQSYAQNSNDPWSPWWQRDNWQSLTAQEQLLTVWHEDKAYTITVHQQGNLTHITTPNQKVTAERLPTTAPLYCVKLGDHLCDFTCITHDGETHLFYDGHHLIFNTAAPKSHEQSDQEQIGHITAPMPGTIVAIKVTQGDYVEKGATLMVLEAMKMEHALNAPIPGRISEIHFNEGDMVKEGTELLLLSAD